MQTRKNVQRVCALFQEQTGVEMALALAPIDPDQPAGDSMRDTDIYSEIAEARREDDAVARLGFVLFTRVAPVAPYQSQQ